MSERMSMSSADTPPITGTENSGESDPPAGPTPTELSEAVMAVIVEGLAKKLQDAPGRRAGASGEANDRRSSASSGKYKARFPLHLKGCEI